MTATNSAILRVRLESDVDDLPDNFWLWDSELTNQFSIMTSNLIANITNKHELPMHSQLSPTYQSTKVALASQIHAPTLSLLTWLPPKDVSNMHTKEYGLDLTSLNHPCRHPSNFSTITGIPQQIEHGKSLTSTYQHAPGLPEMNPQHHRIMYLKPP